MIEKPSLTFYTNIPTPYQQSFFLELSKLFTLNVVYYATSESNRHWNFEFKEDYNIVILRDNIIAHCIQKWIFDFHFSWRIFATVWYDKSDYVIVGGSYAAANATVALIVNKLKGKKVIYFSEPLFKVKSFFKYNIKWIYLRILNVCCDAIFCVGKMAAESFKNYKITPAKFIIPYNIDEKLFQHIDLEELSKYKGRYKKNNEFIILSSGSLIFRKGMDILIKAVKDLTYPNVKLIIIGNGPEKDKLVALCDNDKRIIFAGFKSPIELPYYYAIADIFAFATRYDGWGVVINEAIAANVPIISSKNAGSSMDLLTSDEFGILCESENVNEFKVAIESLIFDFDKRSAIKKNALRLIPLISSHNIAQRVKDILINQIT